METFRVSATTTTESLLKEACEFWGLIERNFKFYKINGGEAESLEEESRQNVQKIVETLLSGSKGEK